MQVGILASKDSYWLGEVFSRGENLRRLTWVMVVVALTIAMLIVYSSIPCRVARDELAFSSVKPLIVSTLSGYAVGFSFNLTNLSSCEVEVGSLHVNLREAFYWDGSREALGSSEVQSLSKTLNPQESTTISYMLDSIFVNRPVKLSIAIDVDVTGSGMIVVFDGELVVPME